MRVWYNEIHLGLHQIICNRNVHEYANYGLIYNPLHKLCVFGKGFELKAMHLIATRWFEMWWFRIKLDLSMFLMVF